MKRAWLLALPLLAGCAGPRPETPSAAAVAPPAAWRGAQADGAVALDGHWWARFGDPVLERLVEEALARNDDVAIAAARVDEARAQFRLAEAQRSPLVTLFGGGGPQRALNAFGVGTDQTAGSGGVSASYDTDLFGRLRDQKDAARAALLASQDAHDTVWLAVASSTASGYLTLRGLDARLTLLRATLQARSVSLQLARRRTQAGYASALDLAQAEADYRATEQLIPAAELAISRQEDGLSVLLGKPPAAIERGLAFEGIAPPQVAAGVPSALLRRRPDIAGAEQQVVAAERQLDASRAAFMPTVQLTASGGLVGSTLIPNPVTVFSLGGSVLAPLIDGGRLKAQEGIMAARRDQAAFAYRRVVLNAFREVEDGLAEQDRLAVQEQDLEAQCRALEAALRLATNRYRAGYSPYLEQLDAQRSLLAAQLLLLQNRSDRLTSSVRLFQAVGGGWEVATRPGDRPAP